VAFVYRSENWFATLREKTQAEGVWEQNIEGYVCTKVEKGTGRREKEHSEQLQGLNSAPVIIRMDSLRRIR